MTLTTIEPEQIPVSELLADLMNHDEIYVNGEYIELLEITNMIDLNDLQDAAQENIRGNTLAIYNLYIEALQRRLA